MNILTILFNWIFISIIRVINSIINFFNTSPQLISYKTAEKLRDSKKSKELIKEIKNKRKNNIR
jgi:hypothetical protein